MKGIIIYENDLRAINAVKLKNASFCYESIEDDKTDTLQGTPVTCESANCNKSDTYDFETGALIALMKMCGSDKVVRACNEAFSYETDIKVLRKDNNNLREANKGLQEEVKRLKGESESHWKKYQRNIQKKQDRINELNNIEEEYIKLREEYDSLFEENEKLQHEYNLCKNSENALKITTQLQNKSIEKLTKAIDGYKNDLYKVAKRCEELEIKESTLNKQQEQLDKREEKISVYFGGRGCGKQYKALVELFKKLPKDKVQAAYVTAYKESLIWCTSQPSIRDQLDSLLESSKYAIPTVDKWLYKIPTKREEMWNDILTCGDCEHSKYVKVKREDLETFAKECNEKKIFSVTGYELNPQFYWSDDDSYTFQIFRKPAGFICAKSVCNVFKDTIVDYLPPMRWDLFKKGRIVVGIKNNNELVEFRKEVERNTGIKNIPMCPTKLCLFYSFDKDDYKIILVTIGEPNIAKINNHKVVYWEDVR